MYSPFHGSIVFVGNFDGVAEVSWPNDSVTRFTPPHEIVSSNILVEELSNPAEGEFPSHQLTGAEFAALAQQWREATHFLSAVEDIAMHEAYQRIIGMGEKALPFILRSLGAGLDHWFWALEAITGESPVPAEEAGDMERMSERWLEWGRRRGLLGEPSG
jgi:hypothetical protein